MREPMLTFSVAKTALGFDWESDQKSLRLLQLRLEAVFRVTCALCFIGHGTWGVITKAAWVPFYLHGHS